MSEQDDTIALANSVLDRPWGDPDDDLAMLSRQFLRALEAIASARNEGFEAARERAANIVVCFPGSAYDRIRAMRPEDK